MTHSNGGYVVPSIPWHVDVLVKRIPDEDNLDMLNGWGETSESMLRKVYPMCDECFTIMGNSGVVGMFGVLPEGRIWLMRGKDIDTVAFRFVRHGHEYIHKWLDKYGTLTGYINNRYHKFLRFLLWEGFILSDAGRGYLQVTLESKKTAEEVAI